MMVDDLGRLINGATVDVYDEYEQSAGLLAVLQDNLRFPFPGIIIDEQITVTGIDIKNDKRILSTVEKKSRQYSLDILDVDIDTHKINGGKWLAAYQKWRKHV